MITGSRRPWRSQFLLAIGSLWAWSLVLVPAIAQSPNNDPAEWSLAGVSLTQLAQDLDSDIAVVRRRAALELGPFACAEHQPKAASELLESLLMLSLRHPDEAIVFWACEAIGDRHAKFPADTQITSDPIHSQLNFLFQDPSLSRGLKLAVAYAIYQTSAEPSSLETLLAGLEVNLDQQATRTAVEVTYPLTASDYLARIGADRLSQRLPQVLIRLEAAAAQNDQAIQSGQTGGVAYHVAYAANRAATLLQDPNAETKYRNTLLSRPATPRTESTVDGKIKPPASLPAAIEHEIKHWPGGIERPNLLWITCEDISPNLGCYGDAYASTPHLDALAKQGVRFDRAFTHAGVCAVLRSGVITGRYPISIGTQHMRTFLPTPRDTRCFPELLRQHGYFCTNRSKTDYQMQHRRETWDREGDTHQDWRERPQGQPFFSVINLTISHESQIRHSRNQHDQVLKKLRPEQRHDPQAAAKFLPPYLPNTPQTRQDWAWYQDNISEMDRQVGQVLQRLADDRLDDSTVVMFWSDHGQGLPRGKRSLYDSGTHVPLIVRWPDRFAAGSVRQDLVTLLDLPPTLLSLCGVEADPAMDGRVFLGPQTATQPDALFFHRDRMDEGLDTIRALRDQRYRYLRNFNPQRTYAQRLDYLEKMPSMQIWRAMHRAGTLDRVQDAWFAPSKALEELYDVENDPYQINNLASDPAHQETLSRMRQRLRQWQVEQTDWGMTPEVLMMQSLVPAPAVQ